jgi:hypothetical protein
MLAPAQLDCSLRAHLPRPQRQIARLRPVAARGSRILFRNRLALLYPTSPRVGRKKELYCNPNGFYILSRRHRFGDRLVSPEPNGLVVSRKTSLTIACDASGGEREEAVGDRGAKVCVTCL